jgi:tripartite-type tricarboxylate transporter receptor subunit TctC
MNTIGRSLRTLAALLTATLAVPGYAQDWPAKAVKITVPYGAGGPSDSMARLTAQRLSEAFGQPFLIENRPGANGSIAGESVARSPADGYTLYWVTPGQVTILPAISKLSYDPVRDFVPITAVAVVRFVLVANRKSMPVRNVAEFAEYVRAHPGKLAYADAGTGSVTHLAMELFLKRLGLQMISVSYKGMAPAFTDVVGGHVPVMFASLGDALQQSGSISLLAVSSDARAPQAPHVPTVIESGVQGFNVVSWNGLMAPAPTPKSVVDRIAVEVARATKERAFAEKLNSLGFAPLGNTPREFAAMISSEIPMWEEAAKSAGLSCNKGSC